jgi:uncharacterized protein
MMPIFADTHFYVGLLNRRDEFHRLASKWAEQERPVIVTTEFVLLEVANFFKQPADRAKFSGFVQSLEDDPATNVVPCEGSWFRKGLHRFSSRLDKEWSLTDCISFVVTEEYGLTNVLTNDHHFEQARFTLLL